MKLRKLTPILAVFVLIGGCASKSVTVTHCQDLPFLVGRKVRITGAPISGSRPAAMVFDNGCQISIGSLEYWPSNLDRQQIQVTGLLCEQDATNLYVIREAHVVIPSIVIQNGRAVIDTMKPPP